MSIYKYSDEYIPYTYLIGWSKFDTWYYGSQTGVTVKANPKNLWTTYYTSSKYVQEFRKLHGEPDIIEIRRTFKDKESTLQWEYKVLKRLNAIKSTKWLNKSVGGKTFYCAKVGNDNPMRRPEVVQKVREKLTGRIFTQEQRKNMSKVRLGYNKGKTYEEIYGLDKAQELKKTRSKSLKGKPKSDKHIQLMRERESKLWRMYPPGGDPIVVMGLPVYCREHNLDVSTMFGISKRPYNNDGSLRYHKGYRIEPMNSKDDDSTKLLSQCLPKADKKTKMYEIVSPCGKIDITRGLGEFARLHGWPPAALYDVKDKVCLNGEPRKYKGFIVRTTKN